MRIVSAFLVLISVAATVPAASAYMPDRLPGNAEAVSKYRQETVVQKDEEVTLADESTVTRGAFIQALMDDLYSPSAQDHCFQNLVAQQKPEFDLVFTDVTVDHPHAEAICLAYLNGIVRGYNDGSFHPEQQINAAEASKLLATSYVVYPYPPIYLKGETWYSPYVWILGKKGILPSGITDVAAPITAEQANEMMRRMRNAFAWPPAAKPLWTGMLPLFVQPVR